MSSDEKIINLQVRIAGLEFHKNMQIDENRKLSRRIDELESIINRNLLAKIPYKCPVCNGKIRHYESMPQEMVDCGSCDKGIVWG